MTVDEFFAGQDTSRQLFDALSAMISRISLVTLRVTKSQVAFVATRAFAWAWMPAKYLHQSVAPLVLTLVLDYRDASPRWKEIVEPSPGRFTHHLEILTTSEIDDEVYRWLEKAFLFRS